MKFTRVFLFTGFIAILTGCQVTSLDKETVKNDSLTSMPAEEQFFHTYHANVVDEYSMAQNAEPKSLRIDYDNGCVYFYDGKHRTIPLLLEGSASWDETTRTLTYFNSHYEVGKIIESYGYEIPVKDRPYFEKNVFASTASKKCDILPVTYLIGTPAGVSPSAEDYVFYN